MTLVVPAVDYQVFHDPDAIASFFVRNRWEVPTVRWQIAPLSPPRAPRYNGSRRNLFPYFALRRSFSVARARRWTGDDLPAARN